MHSLLYKHIFTVSIHSFFADIQYTGYFFTGFAFGKQHQNLLLPGSKVVGRQEKALVKRYINIGRFPVHAYKRKNGYTFFL